MFSNGLQSQYQLNFRSRSLIWVETSFTEHQLPPLQCRKYHGMIAEYSTELKKIQIHSMKKLKSFPQCCPLFPVVNSHFQRYISPNQFMLLLLAGPDKLAGREDDARDSRAKLLDPCFREEAKCAYVFVTFNGLFRRKLRVL